jgi:hypothetical protein
MSPRRTSLALLVVLVAALVSGAWPSRPGPAGGGRCWSPTAWPGWPCWCWPRGSRWWCGGGLAGLAGARRRSTGSLPVAGPGLQGMVATTLAASSRSTTVKTPPDP